MESRVLLVNSPWYNANVSCIALGTLKPILARAGIACDTMHANLLYPFTASDPIFIEHFASLFFVPHLYPDVDCRRLEDLVIDWYFDDLSQYGILARDKVGYCATLGVRPDDVRAMFRAEVGRAGVCLERCLAAMSRPEYDVVGFSLTFETQLPAALALSRRLKALRPDVKIIFGGAVCFEEQADGLVSSFDSMDAVCHTEGDEVIVPLVSALRGVGLLADVPGIAYRDATGQMVRTKSPPLLRDLDRLPMVDYDDYFVELAASDWRDTHARIMFETARGCWWGEKHLCSYCGLNGEGLPFRAKSPERAHDEILDLYHRYPQAEILQCVDNIMDMKYFQTVLPRLATAERIPGRPLRIFYEVKSNLKPQHLALLAAAGVTAVQPGIESFDDDILALMDKGCTALGQVQFVKWAHQEGVSIAYQMLICNPGESTESYRRMIELLPFIVHLPPPGTVTKTQVERFSPLYDRAESFGVRALRPKPHYQEVFPEPGVDLMRLSYQFDYDHDMYADEDHLAAVRRFAELVLDWHRTWEPHRAFFVDRPSGLSIVDRRGGGGERVDTLAGMAAEVFRYLDQARPFASVVKRFPTAEPAALRALLEGWRHRRWVYASPNDRFIAVLPRRYEEARGIAAVLEAAAARPPPSQETTLREGGRVQLALV